jgi:tryptophanyl-tRNA synthetase
MKITRNKQNILVRGYMGKVEEREGRKIDHDKFNLYLVKSKKHWAVFEESTGASLVTWKETKQQVMEVLEDTLNNYHDKLEEAIQRKIEKNRYIKDYKVGESIQ